MLKISKGVATLLRVFISLLLLALLLWLMKGKFSRIIALLSSVNLLIFLLAYLLFLVSVLSLSWRLKFALIAQKAYFTLKDLFCLTLIGHFFSNFMPTSVGGDLVKGYYISKKMKTRLESYSSVLFDRFVGMFSMTMIASVSLLVIGKDIEQKFIIWPVFILLACCMLLILTLNNKGLLKKLSSSLGIARLLQRLKLNSLLTRFYEALNAYKAYKQELLLMLAISIITQLVNFSAVYLVSVSLGVAIPFSKVLLIMPVITVLCMLPVTMNGLGLREWGFMFFFSPNVGEAAALSFSVLYLAMFLITSVLGGILYLFWK